MTQIQVQKAAPLPTPGDLAGYLLPKGWEHISTNDYWAKYAKPSEPGLIIEVPQKYGAAGYAKSVELLLVDLARLESRSAEAILRDVLAASLDVIRIAIQSLATVDGKIPIEAGRRVFDATRDLLLAAACSVLDPRPVFTSRKPDEAMRLLDRAKFGQTEVGSFVVTVECSVPPRLGQGTLWAEDEDYDASLERLTTLQLAHALSAAKTACQEAAASSKVDPFFEHLEQGVSANLCESIAELIDAASAQSVTMSVTFAARRPVSQAVPIVTAFAADNAAVLREAARRLRQDATYESIELIGTLIKLARTSPTVIGDVVLRTDVDGKRRDVHIRLEADSYQKAIEAHREGALVRVVGDLQRDGRTWFLNSPRHLTILTHVLDEN
jgi:hypothetical protein